VRERERRGRLRERMRKKLNIFALTTIASIFVAVAVSAPMPGNQSSSVVEFPRCCQKLAKEKPRCSDTKTRKECYRACQVNCGPKDDLAGKKCRLSCDRWED